MAANTATKTATRTATTPPTVRQHTAAFAGSELISLLSRLSGAGVHDAKAPPFAARLGQWLGWTDAIALSSALETSSATAALLPSAGKAAVAPPASGATAEEDCARARAALLKSVAHDPALSPEQTWAPLPTRARAMAASPPARNATSVPLDFAPYRQAYLARQQSMQTAIGALRGRLRSALSQGSPELARLAAIDAVMDQVLGAREQQLLAAVPTLLERHFRRLRDARDAACHTGETPPGGAWLDTFCQDMRAVLLAELELRFQPVDGLLQALRARPHPTAAHHE